MSVKLLILLEQGLRRCSAALGRPASELICEALQACLAEADASVAEMAARLSIHQVLTIDSDFDVYRCTPC